MNRTKLPSQGASKLLLALATITVGTAVIGTDAFAATPGHPDDGRPTQRVVNPFSPAYQNEYRHGVIPTIAVLEAMKKWNAEHGTPGNNAPGQATSTNTLKYGGGVGGVGVMSGQNKVYLIFYGSQWGTNSTDANGNLKFTNDAAGAAGAAQQMFKGIGTNGETWQNELTQWCDGAATGATSCAAGLTRIPRQSNILAGVWYDNASASPTAATGTQLAQEAIRAAAHFGNTAAGSNRSTYYVILSPKGTNPDNYQGQYCAWHDYTGDGYGVTAPGGDLAFSNQPYNIDSGSGCGVNFVNSGSAGTLDGYTMTLGHEWHEMMSDQFPAGGWTAASGQENSDECAWIAPGSAGGAANVAFSTGTFAEQASWSNDTNNCAISHADVSGGGSGGGGGGSGATALDNGVAQTNLSASTGSYLKFTMAVPAGASNLTFTMSGGTGDADMYVKFGAEPTDTVYDCRPYVTGNSESCSVPAPQTGTYYVNLKAYSSFSGVSLTGAYSTASSNHAPVANFSVVTNGLAATFTDSSTDPDGNATIASHSWNFGDGSTSTATSPSHTYTAGGNYSVSETVTDTGGLSNTKTVSVSVTGGGSNCGGLVLCSGVAVALPSVATGSWSSTYTMPILAGHTVTFAISGGTGDADLYVRAGAAPTATAYSCRPYKSGNSETCTFTPTSNTTYYVRVRAYAAYSGVSLKGTSN